MHNFSVRAAKCILELSSKVGPDYDDMTERLISACCDCQIHQKSVQNSIDKMQQEFQKVDDSIEQIMRNGQHVKAETQSMS